MCVYLGAISQSVMIRFTDCLASNLESLSDSVMAPSELRVRSTKSKTSVDGTIRCVDQRAKNEEILLRRKV